MDQHELTIRGKKKLIGPDNHVYTLCKMTKCEKFGIWVCEKRPKCKGRVWTDGALGEVIKVVTEHNHAAKAARPQAIRVINEMKERAKSTQENPQQIVASTVQQVHANILAILPRKDSLKRTIRGVRNQNGVPALPLNIVDLVIPDEYKQIIVNDKAQQFLFYDSENELLQGRMLIFSTRQNLQLLSQSKDWYADGTFKTSPPLFQQLYTIHVVKLNAVIPVIYALLPNKTRATYVKMLQEVKNMQPGLHPATVMTDFEQASMQAFDIEFPGIQKSGCYFHLCQNVWKRVQSLGLKQRYQQDHEFALFVRMIPAVAFIPTANVIEGFEDLVEHDNFPQDAVAIANYFEDTYIGRRQRRGRQEPSFPIELWNVHFRTLQRQDRTNNAVEGWHRGFQATCGTIFPNIYRFIDALKRQQGLHNLEITQLIAGNPGNTKNKKYAIIAARLQNITADFANRDIIDYLRGIAYNFDF